MFRIKNKKLNLYWALFSILLGHILVGCSSKVVRNKVNADIRVMYTLVGTLVVIDGHHLPRYLKRKDVNYLISALDLDNKWAVAHYILTFYFEYDGEFTPSSAEKFSKENDQLALFYLNGLYWISEPGSNKVRFDEAKQVQQKKLSLYWKKRLRGITDEILSKSPNKYLR